MGSTLYVVIFAVVLFSGISRVRPHKNVHFNLCLLRVMKTSENRESKPSRISEPSPKPRKYLYAKIMAYTVCTWMNSSQTGSSIDRQYTHMDVLQVGVVESDVADGGLAGHRLQVLQVQQAEIPLRTCQTSKSPYY